MTNWTLNRTRFTAQLYPCAMASFFNPLKDTVCDCVYCGIQCGTSSYWNFYFLSIIYFRLWQIINNNIYINLYYFKKRSSWCTGTSMWIRFPVGEMKNFIFWFPISTLLFAGCSVKVKNMFKSVMYNFTCIKEYLKYSLVVSY